MPVKLIIEVADIDKKKLQKYKLITLHHDMVNILLILTRLMTMKKKVRTASNKKTSSPLEKITLYTIWKVQSHQIMHHLPPQSVKIRSRSRSYDFQIISVKMRVNIRGRDRGPKSTTTHIHLLLETHRNVKNLSMSR